MDSVNNRDRWWKLSNLYWTARKKSGTHSFNWHRIKKKLDLLRWKKKSLLLNKTFPYFVVVDGRKNRHFSTSIFPR
jgi:hypothetical protein